MKTKKLYAMRRAKMRGNKRDLKRYGTTFPPDKIRSVLSPYPEYATAADVLKNNKEFSEDRSAMLDKSSGELLRELFEAAPWKPGTKKVQSVFSLAAIRRMLK